MEGAWREGTKEYYGAAVHIQQWEKTDRPFVADDVPRGRYRALVVASMGGGAVLAVCPRAGVAADHTAKGFQNPRRYERLL